MQPSIWSQRIAVCSPKTVSSCLPLNYKLKESDSAVRVVILDTPDDVAKFSAQHVVDTVAQVRTSARQPVLGLATGGTPLGMYKILVEKHLAGELSFKGVQSFNLDEYIGLPPEHDQSYHYYMYESLFKHIDINLEETHVPKTWNVDPKTSGQTYEELIHKAGGIDLQVLGVGTDGHIGFNEVGSSLASRTRIKTLTRQTRQDNARYFEKLEDVPVAAITMGIGTILEARSIILLATGAGKAKAVAGAVEGAVSAGLPASALQLHPQATIVVDQAAASLLHHRDYYLDSEAVREQF